MSNQDSSGQGRSTHVEQDGENRIDGPSHGKAADQIARSLVLVILVSIPALMCLRAGVMSDPDIWWHLRSAQWIVEHRSLPVSDPFSAYGAGKPWQAYSWLYDLTALQLFRMWNLAAIVIYTSAMVAAITAALFRLIDRLQTDFTKSALLTVAGVVSLSGILTPRPWLFSILFFVLEIDVLLQARRTGKLREMFWLPALFVLWSNIHIQFIDGLVVLGIALVEPLAERWWPYRRTQLRSGGLWAVLGGCVLGAMVNPYGWHIYRIAYELVTQSGGYQIITELKALDFRDSADYMLLFMVLSAAAALAWSRRPPFFETALLALGSYLSFHGMRDRWFVAIAACAVLASVLPVDEERRQSRPPMWAVPLMVIGVVGLLAVGVKVFDVSQTRLAASLAEELPVAAVDAIQQQGLSGKLFNDYDWGGYLIWRLRQPVSIDGRSALHGDIRIARNVDTWMGKPDWASDPDLVAAGLVIGPTNLPLTQLLRLDADFKLVYEDKVATVFVRR